MALRVLLLILGLLLGGGSEASAQVTRWQDEQGRIHFTDDPGKVPPRFRTQAEQVELPEPTYAPEQRTASQGSRAGDDPMVQALADALRERWPDIPASKRQQLASTILDRLLLLLAAVAIHTLATLAMFGHAVAHRRPLWALGNLLVFFVPPLYALVALEADALKKGLILVAWATGPAAAVALQWAIAGIVA